MKAYGLAVFLSIGVILAWMYFWLDVPTLEIYPASSISIAPHVYQGDASISSLDLLVLYFVPKDKRPVEDSIWKKEISDAVDKLKSFHDIQLQHRSTITAYVMENPVIGHKDAIEYDTEDTNGGNPEGFRSINREVDARIAVGGDLHDQLTRFNGRKPTIYIVYEGVGSSGSPDGAALINRAYLMATATLAYGTSYFVHEFYHTIGVPDGYDESDVDLESDIMGLGRHRPIEVEYLSASTLKSLGF